MKRTPEEKPRGKQPETSGGVKGDPVAVRAQPRHSIRVDGETYYEGNNDLAALKAISELARRYQAGEFLRVHTDVAFITKRDKR